MKRKKLEMRSLLLCLIVTTVALALLVCTGNSARADSKSILVGITQDVTGINADAGRAERDAILMAIEEWNEKGGIRGHKIEYISRDNAGDPSKATTIANEFVRKGVVGVFGGTLSTVGIPEVKIFTPAQIPMMGGASSTKLWDYKGPDGKSYYFSFSVSDPVIAESAVSGLAERGYKKIAIVHLNAAWPTDIMKYQVKFIKEKYASKYGMEIVGVVEADVKATDLSQEVLKVRAMNPDAVITNLYGTTYIPWFRACSDLDYHPAMTGYWALAETAYNSTEPKFLRNFIGYSVFSPEKKEASEKLKKFIQRYGYKPVGHWCFAYQEAVTLFTAMEAVGFEGPKIRDHVASKMTGTPIIVGNKEATCFFQEGTPYFYSIIGPDGFAYVKIDDEGKQVWVKP